jgi:hypothetical protein
MKINFAWVWIGVMMVMPIPRSMLFWCHAELPRSSLQLMGAAGVSEGELTRSLAGLSLFAVELIFSGHLLCSRLLAHRASQDVILGVDVAVFLLHGVNARHRCMRVGCQIIYC